MVIARAMPVSSLGSDLWARREGCLIRTRGQQGFLQGGRPEWVGAGAPMTSGVTPNPKSCGLCIRVSRQYAV